MHDGRRAELVREMMNEEDLDLLVCTIPANVVMLSGYWPVTGTAVALATRDGRRILAAPEDEKDLIGSGRIDDLHLFSPGSLEKIGDPLQNIHATLKPILNSLSIEKGNIGYEKGPLLSPASYVSTQHYGESLIGMIRPILSSSRLVPADEVLRRLRAIKTPHEIERIRHTCGVVAHAFRAGAERIEAGRSEGEIAARFRYELSIAAHAMEDMKRYEGYVYCMSGPNGANAFRSYARTSNRTLREGDPVLVHCNACIDGYWTDVTRTFVAGEADDYVLKLGGILLEAHRAAADIVRPGVRADEVDAAARDVLKSYGFEEYFKHPTGHGVGFSAIDHRASPMLHPQSQESLQTGMVFNIEPAIYIDDYGGLRHCSMATVTDNGIDVLTPFQPEIISGK